MGAILWGFKSPLRHPYDVARHPGQLSRDMPDIRASGLWPTRLVVLGRVDDGVANELTVLCDHPDVPVSHQ